MDTAVILGLLKANLGMGSTFRDPYLLALIGGVIDELTKEKGILLEVDNQHHIMFVVDLCAWRFTARDSKDAMPEHLRFRMRDLYFKSGGGVVV